MAKEVEYEEISKNDYRNLPEYRRFIPVKEIPESTEFGKNYHLIRPKPLEQLSLENTVYGRKMRVVGILFGGALFFLILHRILESIYGSPSDGVIFYLLDACDLAAPLLAMAGGLKLSGTINSPITIRDVKKYQEAIRKNWEKEQAEERKRPYHPPRKGGRGDKH